ncbi:hypothetical protein BD779DRAFT_1485354 [Infundibulicybe gibba]|nr:hypothetical protein BD779DRAFT_1485354 [Infundibulicybe gibba]
MILGTLLIAGGAVLIAIFGIVPEPTRSLEDLLELFSRPAFVAYFSLLGAAVVICLIITHVVDYSLGRRTAQLVSPASCSPTSISGGLPANPSTLTTGVTNAITETITTERTPLLQLDGKKSPSSSATSLSSNRRRHGSALRRLNHTRLMIAISYASFSGIISGMCLLFAKSGFWRWQAWMLVLGLVAFALLQLWYLHKALTLADPTLVCPSAFCFYNLSSIVNGLVYFDQFSLISPLHLCLVVLGIFILLGGVWVVSIQSGGGGVDIGAWDDESECSSDRGEEPHTSSDPETSDEERSTRIRAVAMGRQTRSESNVPAASTSPDLTGLGLDIGSSRPPGGERRVRVSPLRTRTSRRRTIPPAGAETLVAPGHLHRSTSYTPSSPPPLPINPVSTLGAGFQIGLSPVSPGFAIVPRERRRRVSGLGFSDTVLEAQAKARRRTLSEGDRPDISGGEETGVLPESRGAEGQTPGGKGKGKGRDTGRSRAVGLG